jgi:hypothetical protein
MKKTIVLLAVIAVSAGWLKAQTLPGYGASLQEINTFLGELYNSDEDMYNDTSIISYRNEAVLLLKSGNKEI